MKMALYDTLVPWYRLLDPLEDHREDADIFVAAYRDAIVGERATLLELGSGAGHNAFFLKERFARCTLSDIAEPMLALSRELNPGCEHVVGDMRTLRLGRTFDAVLVHDAVVYMTAEDELRAAARTAFVHTRPGGAAIFAPDCTRESFVEVTEVHEADDGQRALRCMMWSWAPDPADATYAVEYALLLRDGQRIEAVHDRHVEGLFPRATWLAVLREVGYEVSAVARPVEGPGSAYCDEVFVARRPV